MTITRPMPMPRAAMMTRRTPGVFALALVTMASVCSLAACTSTTSNPRATVLANDAVVVIECHVGDAELWVDERFVAHVGSLRRGISLRPGDHRIELRHDRYHTHYQELRLSARERRTLHIELAEILP